MIESSVMTGLLPGRVYAYFIIDLLLYVTWFNLRSCERIHASGHQTAVAVSGGARPVPGATPAVGAVHPVGTC